MRQMDPETRKELRSMQLFLAFFFLIFAVVGLDRLLLYPREPIVPIEDSKTLHRELKAVKAATSGDGIWSNEMTLEKVRLVVGATFVHQEGVAAATEAMTQALEMRGWRRSREARKRSLVSLCRGRYRGELSLLESNPGVNLSLTVKLLRDEPNCPEPE
ncbi:hypothetical protein BURK2_02924 [Burkholderiales bacterium]|nr:MAG: hypothetical protein F9K47_01905 [Burkholderiales bacterium]CAG0999824.1 hypothetical protein BURK2_02924 [Burkholderiales bacterium]